MGTGLGRRSSLQRGQGEVGGSPYHGGERSDGACLAARLPACCGRGATCWHCNPGTGLCTWTFIRAQSRSARFLRLELQQSPKAASVSVTSALLPSSSWCLCLLVGCGWRCCRVARTPSGWRLLLARCLLHPLATAVALDPTPYDSAIARGGRGRIFDSNSSSSSSSTAAMSCTALQ
jgi:hypothetical protein